MDTGSFKLLWGQPFRTKERGAVRTPSKRKKKRQIKAFFGKKYKDVYLLARPTGHAQFIVVFLITENKVSDEPKTDWVFMWHKRSSKELPQHRLYQEAPKILAAALSTWAKPCWLKVMWEAIFVTQSKLVYFFPLSLSFENGEKSLVSYTSYAATLSLTPNRQRTALLQRKKRNK